MTKFPTPEELVEMQHKEHEADVKRLNDLVVKTLLNNGRSTMPGIDIAEFSSIVVQLVADDLKNAGWNCKVVTNSAKKESTLHLSPQRD